MDRGKWGLSNGYGSGEASCGEETILIATKVNKAGNQKSHYERTAVTVLGSLCALNNLVTSGRFPSYIFRRQELSVCREWLLQVERVRPPNGCWLFVPNAGETKNDNRRH